MTFATIDAVLIVALVGALVSGRVPIAAAFLAFVLAVMATGRLEVERTLRLLGEPALVAVVCLILFSNVVGRLKWLRSLVFNRRDSGLRMTLLRFLTVTLATSSVMPNTAVVGGFMGPAARHPYVPAHQLLMPLSYMALTAGMVTQFGTSANLMVVGEAAKAGIDLNFTHFVLPGLITATGVLVMLVLVSPSVLAPRPGSDRQALDSFHVEARVLTGSPLAGRSVVDNHLRSLGHFYLAEIIRGDLEIVPVRPGEIIQTGDRLVFVGDIRYLDELIAIRGLEVLGKGGAQSVNVYQAVISANSILDGVTLKEIGFRARFDGSVFGIRRGMERLSGKLGQRRLRVGDLLVIAAGPDFEARDDVRGNLHIAEVEDPVQGFLSTRDAAIASLLFAVFLGVAIFELVPFVLAALVLVVLANALGLLRTREVRRIFPLELILSLWGALTLGTLISQSGLPVIVAIGAADALGSSHPYLVILAIFLSTWVLTEMLSNVSAALAALPVALAVGGQFGISSEAAALTVAFGASASFLVPFGYQTHLMVMSPGSYTFTDFVRLGLVMLVVYGLLSTLSIYLLMA